ncbi:MAG: acetyl-CoA carboxylase biotin carboxylase subunit [Bacteroidales bacterium]|nr:acetyl-CoA carboxylase biotin carboxylase subunit [Bacteroidales bacterium]
MKIFNKILIANRGEIAVRIIRSAKKMGIQTVAVYSRVDADSMHIRMADEAHCIGDTALDETYLNIDKIIAVAKETHSEAIHPGYGFLAENPKLVAACQEANLIFIGPSVKAIKLMGNKIAARAFVEKLNIPMTKAHTGSLEYLLEASKSIELPVLVKAAAGGGGKGMRIVHDWKDLKSTIESTSREAKAYFGDGEVFVEKYVENPRHIEIQVIGDKHGKVVHLYERECSIQRRFQKVIEESPSPSLTPEVREKMGAEAVKIAQAIGYENAGTIEFLVDNKLNYYFLEMNTRVQVEHPVTEMVTGIDIVREQLLVAAGNKLSFSQSDIHQNGHAIEARIYAEDPENDFLPSPGQLTFYQEPKGDGIRVDSGIDRPIEVKSFFDPMISKLIAFGANRDLARKKLIQALEHYAIHGLKTNITYLMSVLQNTDYQKNTIDTKFCDHQSNSLIQWIENEREAISKPRVLCAFLAHQFASKKQDTLWNTIGFWRQMMKINVALDDKDYSVDIIERHSGGALFRVQNEKYIVCVKEVNPNFIQVAINKDCYKFTLSIDKESNTILGISGYNFELKRFDILNGTDFYETALLGQAGDIVKSPMPGKVIKVLVDKGDAVKKGDVLLIVEAMKMENNILAARDGIIEELNVAEADMVDGSKILLKLEEEIEE